MDQSEGNRRPVVQLRTTILLANLHCPSCVTYINARLNTLRSKPTSTTVSILDHSVTVLHDAALSISSVTDALDSAGYEVFDVIHDPAFTETNFSAANDDSQLEAAVRRWKPGRTEIDHSARQRHGEHCQMCATFNAKEKDDGTDGTVDIVTKAGDEPPRYVAVVSIHGMTCSSCVSAVTNAVNDLSSVSHTDVSLVNHSASIQFSAKDINSEAKKLLEAIEDAGYGAELVEVKQQNGGSQRAAEDIWMVTYAIEGMNCSSCVANISNSVNELEFVRSVNVDLIQHSAAVAFSSRANEVRIKEAIEDAGYDATQTGIKSLREEGAKSSVRTTSIKIDGMHCSECPQRILSALKDLPIHIEKSPSLKDAIITVSYTPDAPSFTVRTIIETISNSDNAFTVSLHRPRSLEERSRQMLAKERKALLARVALTIITAIPTFIIGVVYMNLVPTSDSGRMYLMEPLHGVSKAEWATFIMATPVYFFATDHFHRRTIKEVYALWRPRSTVPIAKRFYRFGSMNMLISLGTTIAYFSSLAELIIEASSPSDYGSDGAQQAYFDSVVFLTMFLLMGRYAEAHMKAKSGDAVAALGNLRPTTALLVAQKTGSVENLSVDLIDVGDVIRVLQGSSPPCDGELLEGTADFDESSLTGESKVVRKKKGDDIFAGTINKGSAMSMRVTGPAGASMLDSIIQVVREGQAKRAPVERVADLLTSYFVPVIVLLAILTWIIWLALGLSGTLPRSYLDSNIGGWPFWSLQFAIAVFVIACPCGLGLAAPTALFVGGGMAAKRGLLVKGGGEAFQEASSLDCIVFDKTGTLTEGKEPKIVEHRLLNSTVFNEDMILGMLKTVEQNSGHPLARAAVDFATSSNSNNITLQSVDEIAGKGMKASLRIEDDLTSLEYESLVGNEGLMQDYGVLVPEGETRTLLEEWKTSSFSVILMALRPSKADRGDWNVVAIFAAADRIRPESADVVASLQAKGIQVWMLSGDSHKTAIAVGKSIGIPSSNVIAEVLPNQKAAKITYLQQSQANTRSGILDRVSSQRNRATVAMVGDGINDAPALAAADVGIAVASGSDVAVQSASFVLIHSDLRAVLTLVALSRAVFRRVILNFFWAAIYNIIALPIAAGVLYPIQSGGSHVRLDPAWAALAMALSSISVVGSSLLLRTRLPLIGFRDQRQPLVSDGSESEDHPSTNGKVST